MSKVTVLVVEDNRDALDAVRLLLEHDGFKVITAQDCSTAFKHLALHRPRLILTDLMLPEMTGLEFIQWVRRTAEFSDTPIIAMSAYDESYLAAAIIAGANAGLHKPECWGDLIETVNRLIVTERSQEVAGVA